MGKKIIGVITGLALVSLAAVGAFASQDAVSVQDDETPAAATEALDADELEEDAHGDGDDVHGIPDDNPSHEPDAGGDCEKGETAIKTTPSGNEVMVPCHAADNEHGGGPENSHGDDVHGIPDDNPSHELDAGGDCEKGETAIMTTPSDNEVMVPCHAADNEHGNE